MIAWLWLTACAAVPAGTEAPASAPVATPAPAGPEAPSGLDGPAPASVAPAAFVVDPTPPIPVGDPTAGALILAPAGDGQVRVMFSRPGSNGCYRQGAVTAVVEGSTVRFSYTTARDGDVCTMALVPGGFSGLLRPPVAGEVVVVVDGIERARKPLTP
jgi:hypothetical protein